MIPFYSLVPVFGISISEQPKIYFNHRNTLISLLSNTLIVIRAAYIEDNIATIQVGAGVVLDSDPQSEADETRNKAQAVINVIMQSHQTQEIS